MKATFPILLVLAIVAFVYFTVRRVASVVGEVGKAAKGLLPSLPHYTGLTGVVGEVKEGLTESVAKVFKPLFTTESYKPLPTEWKSSNTERVIAGLEQKRGRPLDENQRDSVRILIRSYNQNPEHKTLQISYIAGLTRAEVSTIIGG